MATLMEKWYKEYLKAKGDTYRNHVNKFIDYLNIINKADTPININLDDIRNCIGYYVELGVFNAINTMELHLESLKSFYDYLLETGKSPDIFSQMNYEEYKKSLTDEFNLAQKVSREVFSMDTVKDILSKIDNYLEAEYSTIEGINNKKRYIHWSALRLVIKLTLIAPAKRQVICNLKYVDFDKDLRTVVINGVGISIPNSLRRDLKLALEIGKAQWNKDIKDQDKIFRYIVGSGFRNEVLNAWFCSFIKDQNIIGINKVSDERTTYPIEPIMKTAISHLVKGRANLAYVSKVCGLDIGSLERTYYDEIFQNQPPQPNIGESIDWEIRKLEYYSYI
ncbi:MAG: hypothetical protein K0S30_1594 [Clostridia bacterium]|jgi:hypothetical protein|nr:hypothetical protein [Clostridia bacterium]